MDNAFIKDELRNGCIVQLRNGEKYMYLASVKNTREEENIFVNIKKGGWIGLSDFNYNLKNKYGNNKYDIIKLCNEDYVGDNIRYHIINDTDEWTAEREENEKEDLKEMIEEIIEKVDKIAATLKN